MSQPSDANEDILFEVRDGIGLATLNRPQARNALTFDMYYRLADICTKSVVESGCKALIVTGAGGRAFASGTEISAFRDFSTRQHIVDYEQRMDKVLDDIESCPVPTIAAITGACTGGGAAIATCCDLRIASGDMKFGFPIARTLGNCLSVQNLARLAALLGPARCKEILFTARLIQSEEALAIGLVSQVAADHETVMAEAFETAWKVGAHAPLTLRATKEALKRLRQVGAGADDEDLVTQCYLSEDFREGIEAFLAKRPPQWKGR